MDQNLLASGGVGASIVVALGILYKVFVFINHRRIKSTCNGKEVTASIDIDETTPKKNVVVETDVGARDSSNTVGGVTRRQEIPQTAP